MGNGKGYQLKRRRRRNLGWSSAKQRSRKLRVLASKSQAPTPAPVTTNGKCDKGMDMSTVSTDYMDGVTGDDVNGNDDRWLSLELNLEASKVETIILRDDNQKLKARMEDSELSLKEKQTRLEDLEEEVKNKREELDVLRMQLRWERERGAGQKRSLSQMKTFLEKLYSVAKIMMEGLNGSVPPFDEMMGDAEESTGDNELLMEQFFEELQTKFFEWQGNHQLMHNELARTLTIVEELADQIDGGGGGGGSNDNTAVEGDAADEDPLGLCSRKMESWQSFALSETSGMGIPTPCPSSPSSPTLNSSKQFVFFPPTPPEEVDSDPEDEGHGDPQDDPGLTRRNPSRKCKEAIESYFERASSIVSVQQPHQPQQQQQPPAYSQFTFACEHCGDAFCRLAHVGAQLARAENKNKDVTKAEATVTPATVVKPEAEFAKPLGPAPKARAKSGSSPGPRRVTRRSRTKKTEEVMGPPLPKPKLEAVESSGVEHKLAGTFRTIVPQEQMKCLLEGVAPAKKRRFFCKCGKNYAGLSGLFYHIKMIASNNQFQCGLCPVGFKLQAPLVTHMKECHKIEYSGDGFSCMECRRTFVGTMKEVVAHQKLFHNDGEDEDGYLSA